MSSTPAATPAPATADDATTTTTTTKATETVRTEATAAAATTTTTTMTSSKRPRARLTNTNTDKLCKNDTFLTKWMYRFNLWTGLYMLNPYERMVFHLVCWFSITVSLAYFSVFARGFLEGLRRAKDDADVGVVV